MHPQFLIACCFCQYRRPTGVGPQSHLVYCVHCTNRMSHWQLWCRLPQVHQWLATVHSPVGFATHCAKPFKRCSTELNRWFWHNDLFLNWDKSEVIYFRTRQRLQHSDPPSTVLVASCNIAVVDTFKTFRVKLDSTLMFINHVNDIIKACNFPHTICASWRRKRDGCRIVGSRIDYYNSLLHGASNEVLEILQHEQNCLARVAVPRTFKSVAPMPWNRYRHESTTMIDNKLLFLFLRFTAQLLINSWSVKNWWCKQAQGLHSELVYK